MLPLIAVARDGDARAVLPLRRVGRRIEALANWYSFRVAPLVSHGADRDAMLAALARALAAQAPCVTLAPLPDEHGEASALERAFRTSGWFTVRERCDSNHVLEVQGRSFAAYIASRPGPLRSTLKRKAGKVAINLFSDFDEDAWSHYEHIYGLSWKPAEGSPAFLRRFASEEGAAGRLRFGLASVDGKPVAAQFWTVEGGTAFIHKLAHDEAARAFSPGTALTAALFEQVIDRDGVNLVDFGTGNDAYKRDWMEEVRPRYRIDAFRPLWPGNWPAMAKALLRSRSARPLPPAPTLSRGAAL